MRQSSHLGTTLKQEPREMHSQAHRLLLRGGFMKPLSAGLVAVMPLLRRVLNKLSASIQTRLETQGFEDCLFPVLQSRADLEQGLLWASRFGQFAVQLDQRGTNLGLGSGSEVVFAGLIRSEVSSVRQLPKRIQHLSPLFWDDLRSRKGLVRLRESLSLQTLGCDADAAAAEATAVSFRNTILEVCAAVRLESSWVLSQSAKAAEQELALAAWNDQGSDPVLICSECRYAATVEAAQSRLKTFGQDGVQKELESVYGPGLIGVEPLAEYLGLPIWKTTKTLLLEADGRMVAVMVRGDCEVNEAKVKKHLQCRELKLASPEAVREQTGAEVGYAGPVNLPHSIPILADEATRDRVNFECGANRSDYHLINVNFERDLDWPVFGDFKQAASGHFCPQCSQGRLKERLADILGWSTILDSSFARNFKCQVQLPEGRFQPLIFSSCGLDLVAMATAVLEHHHDQAGPVWPRRVSPYQVHLLGLNLEQEDIRSQAEHLYQDMLSSGIEVLFDERNVRPGEKFGDADLLGIPLRVILSKRTWLDGQVELKRRDRDTSERLPLDQVLQVLKNLCREEA